MAKALLLLLVGAVTSARFVCCAPVPAVSVPVRMIAVPAPAFVNNNAYPPQNTRGPLDFIGEWIQQSEWFPIEINVPDTLSNIGQGISMGWNNLGNTFQNWAQNLPWFNRFPMQQQQQQIGYRPPTKYFVLVPTNVINRGDHQNSDKPPQSESVPGVPGFSPFENAVNQFPVFP